MNGSSEATRVLDFRMAEWYASEDYAQLLEKQAAMRAAAAEMTGIAAVESDVEIAKR